jgi:3-ketosteroid 9alpha-monooxygenase subunit A
MELRGFPRGWFVIETSRGLEAEEVKPIKYFGRDMVLFRGESGEPHVLDAFCPHLGAHLGHGGKVVGDTIRCPFHAWRFDGTGGKCVEVPYAKRIPNKAEVGAHPVQEKNGLIFMWNCPKGTAPDWEIPVIEHYAKDGWTEWDAALLHIKTHPKEVVENLADKAHFGPVHGTWVDWFENEYKGHIGIQRARGVAYPRGGGEDRFELQSTYYGPGYMLTEMKSVLPNILLLAHTPIDEHSLHLRFGAMIDLSNVREGGDKFTAQYRENLLIGFREDIQLWENKVYRDRPVLVDGDGDLGGLRRWYAQFYEGANAA